MANKTLFQTIFGGLIPATDAINSQGALAYALSPKQALAQYGGTASGNRAGKSPSHETTVYLKTETR